MPIVTFSVRQDQYDLITEAKEKRGYDSENLVCKAIVLDIVGKDSISLNKGTKSLEERIDHLEKGFDLVIPDENIDQDIAKLNEEVSRLNDWLKQLDRTVKDDQRLTQLEEAIEDIRTSLEIIEGQVKDSIWKDKTAPENLVKSTVKPPPPPKRGRRTSKD